MKRTASTSISILAVSSAITALSGKPVIRFSYSPPPITGKESSVDHLPSNGLAATVYQGALVGPGDFHLFRRRPWRLFQGNRLLVGRHPVMLGAIERTEGFKFIERALLLEHLGVGFDGDRRIEHAGNAADRNLLGIRMRRVIGAKEIASLALGRGLPHRGPITLRFHHRHHIHPHLQSL